MRLFLEIIIAVTIALIIAMAYVRWVIRMTLVPVSLMLFHAIPGQEAENFCNVLCRSGKGEKMARIFYMLYRFGYTCTDNPECEQILALMAEKPETLQRMINITRIQEVKDQ